MDVAGDQVIAVTDDQRVREGDQVGMAVDWSRVHVFASGEPGMDTARLGSAAPLGAGAGALGGAR